MLKFINSVWQATSDSSTQPDNLAQLLYRSQPSGTSC